jgi:hypothetical protein
MRDDAFALGVNDWPRGRPAARRIELEVTPEVYDADPARHAKRLYAAYLARETRP